MVFLDSIPGLEKVFRADVKAPKIILVTGPPGSMKTSFCFGIMARFLAARKEVGLYTTLEETMESHLMNMGSVGVQLPNNLYVSDFTEIRDLESVGGGEQTDYIHFIERLIANFKKKHGDAFTLFTLDSLGALYSLLEHGGNMRKRMFFFFKALRDAKLTTFIIMERAHGSDSQMMGNEGFLADGIINLGLAAQKGKLLRFLQVEKMRTVSHSMERHMLDVTKEGVSVLGPVFAAE